MTKIKITFFAAFFFSSFFSHAQSGSPEPYGTIPSARQLKWHETEMYCLIHFTPTTFQNKEWGYGDAAPTLFNPTKFDASQIVAAAKAGGFKGVIVVAKHHDGFALWPTHTSSYNISRSPWKNGKGDMVKEFMQAARHLGLKFGIYCSPWDRNNVTYGTPAYLKVYRDQLKELYSNYGPLFMSWHDGANGGDGYYDGKKETRKVDQSGYYDWLKTWEMTRKMQPDANIFSDIGPDIRWVGNEKGIAPETSWSSITLKGKDEKLPMPGFLDDANLGSGTRDGKQWIPFEGDVSLRPGWFYHPEEDDETKTAAQLFHIYCNSVGRGGSFDLGLSPTKEGLLHQNDVKSLLAFGKLLKQVFALNLAKQAKIEVSNLRGGASVLYSPAKLTDNDRYSYWATDDDVHDATATLTYKKPIRFNLIRLRENIKLGQRLDSVIIETFKDNHWQPSAKATSIGANRIIQLEQPEVSSKIRIHVYAPVCIALSEIGLFLNEDTDVANSKSVTVGDELEKLKNHSLPHKKNTEIGEDKSFHREYPNSEWKAYTKDNTNLELDFGAELTFSSLSYLPKQGKTASGLVAQYEIAMSSDGKTWTKIAEGEFANIKANPILQRISLTTETRARYLRLTAIRQAATGSEKSGFMLEEIAVYK
jgi:alpha-L-fucosidase